MSVFVHDCGHSWKSHGLWIWLTSINASGIFEEEPPKDKFKSVFVHASTPIFLNCNQIPKCKLFLLEKSLYAFQWLDGYRVRSHRFVYFSWKKSALFVLAMHENSNLTCANAWHTHFLIGFSTEVHKDTDFFLVAHLKSEYFAIHKNCIRRK